MDRNLLLSFTVFIYTFLLILQNVHPKNLSSAPINVHNSTEKPEGISQEKTKLKNYYRCSPRHRGYLIAKCPTEYTDGEIIRKCEKGLFPLHEEDISIIIPATSEKTGIHYANQYCATCHNDPSTELWELSVGPSWTSEYSFGELTEDIVSTLKYSKMWKSYTVNTTQRLLNVTFSSIKPDIFNLTTCTSQFLFMTECPSVFDGPKDCTKFTGNHVCSKETDFSFTNLDCARCNDISEDSLRSCILATSSRSALSGRVSPANKLFSLRISSNANTCSIPAIAKYYCGTISRNTSKQ